MSPERRFPLLAIEGYMNSIASASERPRWQAFANAVREREEDHLVERHVPCMTPAALLEKVGVDPGDLVMVAIDAEGADVSIVTGLLGLPGFRPGYLQFELQDWESEEHQALHRKLQRLRFDLGRTYEDGRRGTDTENCVAVPAAP